ncbi:hypothetical protein GQ600_22981 [Phytophthora cactorum]|nr:hypothetical protein GQ600_22981 [Phytophthora cactorum]
MKLKASGRQLNAQWVVLMRRKNKRAIPMATNERAPQRCGTLQKLWTPTQRELNVFIAHWLISSGLPYNTVASEYFKLLVQRLTGDPYATIRSRQTNDGNATLPDQNF